MVAVSESAVLVTKMLVTLVRLVWVRKVRVQVGGAVFPVLRCWEDGFALDAGMAPHLRGLVDLYEGDRHIFQCLIIASTVDAGELICDYKRSTLVLDRPALDYWRDENTPVALIPKA